MMCFRSGSGAAVGVTVTSAAEVGMTHSFLTYFRYGSEQW